MKFVFSFVFVLFFQLLKAQQKIDFLDTLTVTATNSTQKNSQTGRNIIVIKPEQFKNVAVNSIDEWLKYIAGVEVHQRGAQGSQSDILIRGGTFQQVLVLIDGIRLNDPLTGHFNGYIPIHPSEIERIEILKGPSSAVWGADAVGGVIHIITKAFTNKQYSKQKQLGFQLGEYGLANFNANISIPYKKNYFSLGAFSNNATGQKLRGTNGFFNIHTFHGSFSTVLGKDWRLSYKSTLDFRKFNAQNFYTTFKSDTANEEVNSNQHHLQLIKKFASATLTNSISYKQLRDIFQFNLSGTPNDNNSKQFVLQTNYEAAINENTKYVTGLQIVNKSIKSNDRGNHSIANSGAWFIMKHKIGNSLFVNEGIRFDLNSRIGFVVSPQLNAAYNNGRWNCRFSIAKGIRDADFTERFNNYNKVLVTSGSIGNPDLKAEKTFNAELGSDYMSNSLRLSATAFYRTQKQLIDWTPTAYVNMPRKTNLVSTGSYALASNLKNVTTYGIELDVSYEKVFSEKKKIICFLNITKLDSKNEDSILSFYISSHAKLLSNASIVYQYKKLLISVNSLYKLRTVRNASAINATLSKNYFLLNSKVAYQLQSKFTAFLQASNVFNKTYSDLLGAQMPGRWLSAGVQCNF